MRPDSLKQEDAVRLHCKIGDDGPVQGNSWLGPSEFGGQTAFPDPFPDPFPVQEAGKEPERKSNREGRRDRAAPSDSPGRILASVPGSGSPGAPALRYVLNAGLH